MLGADANGARGALGACALRAPCGWSASAVAVKVEKASTLLGGVSSSRSSSLKVKPGSLWPERASGLSLLSKSSSKSDSISSNLATSGRSKSWERGASSGALLCGRSSSGLTSKILVSVSSAAKNSGLAFLGAAMVATGGCGAALVVAGG